MLFNYRYVEHDIEKFQTWLDHLVKEVWCKAEGNFDLNLLHVDLRAVVLEIYNTEDEKPYGRTGDWLYGPIRKIFDSFKNLSEAQRQQVSVWYDNNNDIEALCSNDPTKEPITYSEIQVINDDLAKALSAFCQSLFNDVIHLKAVTNRTAEIDSHYDAFVKANDEGKCPYCGYGDIKGQYNTKREAYDHFLPKGIYPFNSVNFRNLAPMCHECNSSYKLKKDPIVSNATRRKAFYSFATIASGISLEITFANSDIDQLCPANITLTVTAPGRDEEVGTWKDVFGIEERYKAKCCGNNDGKVWLSRVIDECENYGLTAKAMLEAELRVAENKPWSDSNFLKKPFLLACQKVIEELRS